MASSNALQAAGLRTRVGGSAFTVFTWANSVIGFGQQIATVSPTPVGAGATPIQPMDSPYAIEVITPAAQTIGTITMQLKELYNQKVWEQLAGLAGAPDLVNIFIRMAAFGLNSQGGGIQVAKLIRPPLLQGVNPTNPLSSASLTKIQAGNQPYGEIYNNALITNVQDGETIDIGTMDINKQITIAYTSITLVAPAANGGAADYQPNLAVGLAARTTPLPS